MRKRPKLTENQFDQWAENIGRWIAESVTPFEKDTPEKKRRRIARAENDKLFFMQTYLPHYFACAFGEFHKEWAELGDMKNQAVFIAAPREHGKSTFFTFGDLVHDVCFNKRKYIIVLSDTNEQATEFTIPIRQEFEDNVRIKHDFGDLSGKPWRQDRFVANGVMVFARGRKDKIRGIKYRQHRPDKVIVDDFENDENVDNPKLVKKGIKILRGTVIGGLGEDYLFLMVGNLFHPRSILSSFIAEKDKEGNPLYLSKMYRAILDDGKPEARPLWPEKWSMERLEAKRRIMRAEFNQEMMNLTKAEGSAFREEWIKNYDRKKVLRRSLVTATFVDPSAKSGEENDFKAVITVGMDTSDMWLYVLHAWIRHATIDEMFAAAYGQFDTYGGRVGIEENMLHEFLHYAIVSYAKKVKRYLPWEPLTHSSNKNGRIIGTLSWQVENGILTFDPPQSDQAVLIEQLLYLENKNVHDDGPDALEGAVRMVQTEAGSAPRVISAARAAPMPQYGEVFDMEKYYL